MAERQFIYCVECLDQEEIEAGTPSTKECGACKKEGSVNWAVFSAEEVAEHGKLLDTDGGVYSAVCLIQGEPNRNIIGSGAYPKGWKR